MADTSPLTGSFTIPGEAGYEELTLSLAREWGADCVRDCDGTELSEKILSSGMDVYSTICIIREHNDFALSHPGFQQQTFLSSKNVMCVDGELVLPLLDGYFQAQFAVNDAPDSLSYWQVFDRTNQREVHRERWRYDRDRRSVVVENAVPFHEYSVNFLAYRVWEEINMYNHVTNKWDREPLRQLDPRYPEVQDYLAGWLESWCASHPHTAIVRFTSLFYNFVWIWGEDPANRNLFTDWASYDFTVSPLALGQFASEYGYTLSSEDFINGGFRNPGHIAWNRRMKDYLDFTNKFVVSYARRLVDVVHRFGKRAYVFYDDSWVGMEPYGERFASIGFDGIIKCVFSGFEARLCAGVRGPSVHELRLHPYLFPVGLGGTPTFSEGGDPASDALRYWVRVRRALLRSPVERIGLGGYLHLTEAFPDFIQCIADIAKEFRMIKDLHEKGRPLVHRPRIAVLTGWGKLRSWTCGGHYHEHPELDLINILESLSGLPFEVTFLSFEELASDVLNSVDLVINAGFAASAWSGGDAWGSDAVVETLTRWVWDGGVFLACNEASAWNASAWNASAWNASAWNASAWNGCATCLRMSPVLGVALDDGRRLCHGKWPLRVDQSLSAMIGGAAVNGKENLYLLDKNTVVAMAEGGNPCMTVRDFGKGRGLYLSEFRYSGENTRMLERMILWSCSESPRPLYSTGDSEVSCTFFEQPRLLVFANTSGEERTVRCSTLYGDISETVKPFGMSIRKL